LGKGDRAIAKGPVKRHFEKRDNSKDREKWSDFGYFEGRVSTVY
jgi:hypothetical protein